MPVHPIGKLLVTENQLVHPVTRHSPISKTIYKNRFIHLPGFFQSLLKNFCGKKFFFKVLFKSRRYDKGNH